MAVKQQSFMVQYVGERIRLIRLCAAGAQAAYKLIYSLRLSFRDGAEQSIHFYVDLVIVSS